MDLIFTIAFVLLCIFIIGSIAFVGSVLFITLYTIMMFLIVTIWIWLPITLIGYFLIKLIRSR